MGNPTAKCHKRKNKKAPKKNSLFKTVTNSIIGSHHELKLNSVQKYWSHGDDFSWAPNVNTMPGMTWANAIAVSWVYQELTEGIKIIFLVPLHSKFLNGSHLRLTLKCVVDLAAWLLNSISWFAVLWKRLLYSLLEGNVLQKSDIGSRY